MLFGDRHTDDDIVQAVGRILRLLNGVAITTLIIIGLYKEGDKIKEPGQVTKAMATKNLDGRRVPSYSIFGRGETWVRYGYFDCFFYEC